MGQQQQQPWLVSKAVAAKMLLSNWWTDTVVPALLNDEAKVEKLASSRGSRWTCTQGCVQGVRPYVVVLVLVIMAVWLPLDVLKLDGIVPGVKDTLLIEGKLWQNEDEVKRWYTGTNLTLERDGIYNCPCTYSRYGAEFLQTPYALLLPEPSGEFHDLAVVNTLVGRFVRHCNGSVFDLNTALGRKAAAEASRFIWAAAGIRVRPQFGSSLFTYQAWHTSRLAAVQSECYH
jgi:hypothetical protein